LKTGQLLGASPRQQQWGEIAGVIASAFVLAPILNLLHQAYGIGEGLKAPQATLFVSLAKSIFGSQSLPLDWVAMGAGLTLGFLALNHFVHRKSDFRWHPMAVAVGLYLPLSLATPILMGGLAERGWLRWRRGKVERAEGSDSMANQNGIHTGLQRGLLLASGLVAGEALAGVALAIYLLSGMPTWAAPGWLSWGLSALVLLGVAGMLGQTAWHPSLKTGNGAPSNSEKAHGSQVDEKNSGEGG
jgi:putative OPT family oligopeptide transporter